MDFSKLADDSAIKTTVDALKSNGIEAMVVENGEEAKKKVLEMIPKGAEVMHMSSVTLETLGLDKEIDESGNYNSVKGELAKLDRTKDAVMMQKIGAAPEWAVGSVHAVTQEGHVYIASNTGSQLPAYVYGSMHVIWVVSTKKIVKNGEDALKRIYDYIVPLEAKHMEQKFGHYGTNVSKLLIVNKELNPDRIKMILVKEELGY
jgi:hypothetical protein